MEAGGLSLETAELPTFPKGQFGIPKIRKILAPLFKTACKAADKAADEAAGVLHKKFFSAGAWDKKFINLVGWLLMITFESSEGPSPECLARITAYPAHKRVSLLVRQLVQPHIDCGARSTKDTPEQIIERLIMYDKILAEWRVITLADFKAKTAKAASAPESGEAQLHAEREAHEAQLRAEREAHEAQLRAEREAHEAQLHAEREAHEAQLRAKREAHEAQLRAERETHQVTPEPAPVLVHGPLAQQIIGKTDEEVYRILGEALYPLIYSLIYLENPDRVGKYTGMILELDNKEILSLIYNPDELKVVLDEAKIVLDNAQIQAERDALKAECDALRAQIQAKCDASQKERDALKAECQAELVVVYEAYIALRAECEDLRVQDALRAKVIELDHLDETLRTLRKILSSH